jgi:hypothetical protein
LTHAMFKNSYRVLAPRTARRFRDLLSAVVELAEGAMGFNALQPGKVRRADLLIAGVAVLVIVALIVWTLL